MIENKIKSYAKINLHLGVLSKLDKKFHKIETLISFINLYDIIKLKEIRGNEHEVIFKGVFAKGLKEKNTISNLLETLEKKKLLTDKKFKIEITKYIPLESGMGGGSMNASSILKFFLKKKIIKLKNNNLTKICKIIGSDVIFGLDTSPKIFDKTGKLTKLKRRFNFYVVILKPNFGCSTKLIYKNTKNFSKPLLNNKKLNIKKLTNFKNDLELTSLKLYPKLKNIKKSMSLLPNICFHRMTGSGSTFVGYFLSKKYALYGSRMLKKKYKNYWCILTKTI